MHEHIIQSADDCPPPGGYCRTHELNLLLLAALYAVSRVLSRSLDFNESLRDVLRVLHDEAGLTRGLISVVNPDSGKLNIHTIYTPEGPILDDAQYGPGEGIIGLVLEKPRTIKLVRAAERTAFPESPAGSTNPRAAIHRRADQGRWRPQGCPRRSAGSTRKTACSRNAPSSSKWSPTVIGQSLRLAHGSGAGKINAARGARPAPAHRPPPVRLRQHGRPLGGDAPGGSTQARLVATVERHGADPWSKPAPARNWSPTPSITTRRARRRDFVSVNCAALRENLLERTVRARARRIHRRRRSAHGTFRTGARRHAFPRRNRRETRHRSRPSCCASCRRANSSASAETKTLKTDVRVIAATNRDLDAAGSTKANSARISSTA